MAHRASQGRVRSRSTWASRIGAVIALALVGVVGTVPPAQASTVTVYNVGWENGEAAWTYINWGHSVGRSTDAPTVRSGSWGLKMMESSLTAQSPGEARRTFTYATTALTCGASVYIRNQSPTSQKARITASRTNGTILNSVTQTLPANSGWTKVYLSAFTANTTAIEISLYALPFTSTGLGPSYWAVIGWDDFMMNCSRA